MTDQVDVYIVENGGVEEKLRYACRIAAKAYEQKLKVYFSTDSAEMNSKLDALLWTFSQNSFVPHCVIEGETVNWDDFPVQVGSGCAGQVEADVLINLADAVDPALLSFPRIVDLVSSDPVDRKNGRERFRRYRELGNEPNTHRLG